METGWSDDNRAAIAKIGAEAGFSEAAALAMAEALSAGGGGMAQFNHPDLGGFGQWSSGGMLMIGDMFNDGLKGRVRTLATNLSQALAKRHIEPAERSGQDGGQSGQGGRWWPQALGAPSSSGSQNGQRYAVFPEAARLAVEREGKVSVHDTGTHRINGVSQQQGSGSSLRFSSQSGSVAVEDLPEVGSDAGPDSTAAERSPERPAEPRNAAATSHETAIHLASHDTQPAVPSRESESGAQPASGGDSIAFIRKLAELKAEGIITDEEFSAKKAELLGRL